MERLAAKAGAARGHAGEAARAALRLLAALALAAACVPAAAFSEAGDLAFADSSAGAAVGDEITVDYGSSGTVVFEVTVAATESEPGEVTVTDGTGFTGSELALDGVAQTTGGVRYEYAVTAVGDSAFKDNASLKVVSFASDLTGATNAVGEYAFSGCSSLVSVSFPAQIKRIASYAFQDCTSLEEVAFPDGACCTYIASYAFQDCTSLVSISVPALLNASKKYDFYTQTAATTASSIFTSGWSGLWGGSISGPVGNPGINSTAFDGCTSLETIEFEAGNSIGMFAYWNANGIFDGLSSLKAVVYNGAQAYWGNPNASMQNKTYYDLWEDCPDVELYYSVDYYATADYDEAMADDAFASEAYCHVNFKRSTPVDSICAGSVEEEWVYAGLDGGTGADSVPDPNEAAEAAGLVVDEEHQWVWKLTGSQQRRTGLDDSCRAYLVSADDLSAGRVANSETQCVYDACEVTLSQCTVEGVQEDTLFDPFRYADKYQRFTNFVGQYDFYIVGDQDQDIYGVGGLEHFLSILDVRTADGTAVDLSACSVTFQSYDAESGTLGEASDMWGDDGAYLMTVTPGAGSGLSGYLQEWVVVAGQSVSVYERYTSTSADTAEKATIAAGNVSSTSTVSYPSAPYVIAIDTGDPASTLMATGYASLNGTALRAWDFASLVEEANASLEEGEEAAEVSSGFWLAATFTSAKQATAAGECPTYGYDETTPDAASLAAFAYQDFTYGTNGNESYASTLGASAEWGDTAVVVDPRCVGDVAAAAGAYAYAKCAPVFFLNDDGTVGDETLACLQDFEYVVVMGDEGLFPASAYSALEEALGEGVVERIEGDAGSACALSLAVAQMLLNEGLVSVSDVAVVDAADPADAVCALNYSGYVGGLTLVSASAADSKRISAFLRENCYAVQKVSLFGRDSSNLSSDSFDLVSSLESLWSDDDAYVERSVEAGDALVLYGAVFTVDSDGSTLTASVDSEGNALSLWPHGTIAAGTYWYDGVAYTLAAEVAASEGWVETAVSDDDSDSGLSMGLGTSEDVETASWISPTQGTTATSENSGSSSTTTSTTGSSSDTSSSGGSLTVGSVTTTTSSSSSSGSGSSLSSGTSSSSSGTSTGLTLDLGDSADEEAEESLEIDSDEGESSEDAADTSDDEEENGLVWDDDREGDQGETGESSAEGLPAAAVGGIVAAAVAAVGAILWFALRRRSQDGEDMEFAE